MAQRLRDSATERPPLDGTTLVATERMCATCREHGIGALYVEGDQACERGDLPALAEIAEHLAEHVDEPLHCELVALARQCVDSARATLAWTELKQKVQTVVVRS